MKALQVLALCMLALVPDAAHAVQVVRKICVKHRVLYEDVSELQTDLDDDFFTDNDDKPGRGVALQVHNNNLGSDTMLYMSVDSEEVSGDQVACTQILLNSSYTYDLKVKAVSHIDSHTMVVKTDDVSAVTYYYQADTAWSPHPTLDIIKVISTPVHPAWNILAAAEWALKRRDAGLQDLDVHFYTQECQLSGVPADTSCHDYGCTGNSCRDYIWIDIDDPGDANDERNGDQYRTTIVHEIGHMIARAADDGNQSPLLDRSASDDGHPCDGGLANNPAQGDCELWRPWDYDGNGLVDVLAHEGSPSCFGAGPEAWAAQDYMADQCSGTLVNRGTVMDWLRTYWDVVHWEGLTTTQVYQIWGEADPWTWDADCSSSYTADHPKERMEQAASDLGLGTEWNTWDDVNGVR